MTTAWTTARAAIASILDDVTITSPITDSIKRVYETQSETVTDFPSAVIMGATKRVQRSPGLRTKMYDVRLRLLVKDADLSRTADVLDAFTEAAIDAFDAKVKLGLADNYHIVEGPNWGEPTNVNAGGQDRSGVDGVLVLSLKDAATFGA